MYDVYTCLYSDRINTTNMDIQNPGASPFTFHAPCNYIYGLSLKITSTSPWIVLTKNCIYCSYLNIIFIADSGTPHLWQHQDIVVCWILSYNVCASTDTITASNLLIIMKPKSRLFLIPASIEICPMIPLYWSMVIILTF